MFYSTLLLDFNFVSLKRMENLRIFVNEQCRIISDGIQEEADHWKEIYAMLQQ